MEIRSGDLPAGVTRELVVAEAPGAPRAGAGGHPCQGTYARPAGSWPRVAFVATHYGVDFSEHYLSTYLAARGYGFLGWNTRFRGQDQYFLLDRALVDVGLGVTWLRAHGVEVVVALGNSGGGSLMAAYHAQSQGDVVRRGFGPALLPEVAELPAGDLYVSLAAHPGRPDVLTGWLDAAVLDETDPLALDPDLDLYAPARQPPFDPAWVARYRAAQEARNQRITDWAKAELGRLNDGGVHDRLFVVARTWADPRFVDPSLDPSDRPTPSCYFGDPRRANGGAAGIGMVNTLRSWLSMWSLETSQCRGEEHLTTVTVPALVIQATADSGVFPSDAARIFDRLGAPDKQRVDVAGDHYFRTPAGARDQVADVIAEWVGARSG